MAEKENFAKIFPAPFGQSNETNNFPKISSFVLIVAIYGNQKHRECSVRLKKVLIEGSDW